MYKGIESLRMTHGLRENLLQESSQENNILLMFHKSRHERQIL